MILSKRKFYSVDLEELAFEKIRRKKTDEILIIVPTNRKVRSLRRFFIEISDGNAVSNLNIHTLSTLSTLIFEELFNGEYFILDDATAIIKLKKVFSELKLKYFPDNQEITQGILFEIKNVISEFKKKGITVEYLQKDLELLSGSERNKAEDLISIYKKYQSDCLSKNLFELGDIYKFITEVNKEYFINSFRELFPEVDTVVIEGFDELTSLEIKIVNSVFDLVANSFISFEINENNTDLFSHPLRTITKLKNTGFIEISESKTRPSNLFIEIIKKNLFTIRPKVQSTDVKLFLYSAQNRNDEISFIAKKIKTLIRESDYKTQDICVVFNQISNYSTIINEIFLDYNIQYNLTDRYLLSNSPPVISLVNLLEILENNYYYKNIFRALSGEWISLPGVDKNNLLRVSANLKIVSGLNNWERKINNIIEEIDLKIDSDFNYLPKESYLKAKEDIQTIANILEPFTYQLSPKEFLYKINNLIYQLGIVTKAVNNHESYVEKNTRGLTEFVEMLYNITEILEIEYGNRKQNLNFYLDKIKAASEFTRYNVKENPGVLITSVDEIRGLKFKVLILGGLIDGEFPTRYSPEVFIPHKYKQLEEGHLSKERYKFFQTLSVAEEQIIMTYPKSIENAELTPSSFLNDLEAVVKYENISSDNYELIICSPYEIKKNISIKSLQRIDSQTLEELNINLPHIIANSEIDIQRINNPSVESIFNGYLKLNKDEVIINYFELFNSQQIYSASKLEEYVKCPFQFLVKRILNLKPYKEPKEEVEAFELGTLVHSILYEFYSEITKNKLVVENCTDEEFDSFVDMIFDIAERKIDKNNFSNPYSFFELEKILGINGAKKFSILYKFLEEERKSKMGFKPVMFEKSFGKNSEHQIDYNGVKFNGFIDRVDINENEKIFSIIDYKLRGKKITKEDINSGISLQLPLYLYAAKKILQSEFDEVYEPYSAEIFSLKLHTAEFGRKIIHNSSSRNLSIEDLVAINNNMIDIFKQTADKFFEKISNAEFHLSTLEERETKVCSYCDFSTICRVKEII